jgi:group I intron endonuclease
VMADGCARMGKSGIYIIENKKDGNQYVGSSKDITERINNHFGDLRRQTHHGAYLQHAYNKYGKDAFSWKPILYCERTELYYYEQALIDRLRPAYN